MGVFDRLLKQLVTDYRRDFAAWLLGAEADEVEPIAVELPSEPLRTDAVFRVQMQDGNAVILHIEPQGRRTHRPMSWRMLDYMLRLAELHQLPMVNTVLYLDRYAGSRDTGQHQHHGPNGEVILSWNYRVVHLWRMSAEDILAIGRRSLLPLAAFTHFQSPAETLPRLVGEIRAEPDTRRQAVLLGQLFGLLRDEELIAMTDKLLSDADIEELKDFPILWESFQRYLNKAKAEQLRDTLLDTLATRFNPPAQDYRRAEQAIAPLDDLDHLNVLFHRALLAADFAEFARQLHGEAEPGL